MKFYKMQLTVLILLLFSQVNGESTLKLVNLVYRHGDRSPVVIFPTDPNKEDKWPQGLGWLSKAGMQEHYSLGQFLKKRYIETGFLNTEYKHSEIKIDSSDENRCLMSAYCNLAGLFPPDLYQQFNYTILWQPIPVQTRPGAEDNTLNLGETCPRYLEAVNETYYSPEVQKEEKQNKAFYEWLGNKSGINHENINKIWQVADTLLCEKAHNLTLAPWANETVYDKLRSLNDFQFEMLYKTTEMKRLKGGPLLSEFIDNMKNKTKKDKPISVKMFMYSAHDTTVAALLSALQVFNDVSPPYAAMVIAELHQVAGDYYVKLYYKNSTTDSDLMESLTIPNCTATCRLDKFIELTKPVIPVDWLKECGLRPQPSPSSTSKFSTAWIVVIALAALLVILLLINVTMFVKYKRNRPGFQFGKINEKA